MQSVNEQELNDELSNIEKEIKVIKETLKPLESRKKEIKVKLEEIKFQVQLDSGDSKELLEFYKLKIPKGDGKEYMSWSINDAAYELFEKYVRKDYWNRYLSYCFTEELNEALFNYDFGEDEECQEDTVREDVINSFIDRKLMSLDSLTEAELEIITDYIAICKGIAYDNFKYDW